jgi:sulfite oxidase
MLDSPTGGQSAPKPLDFVIHEQTPLNCEPPAATLIEAVTPLDRLFTRNHHPHPERLEADWQLTIDGLVQQPLTISLAELRAMPQQQVTAVMECAGNHRAQFAAAGEPADGVPWLGGAVANISWSGVALRTLLERAGPLPGVVHGECHSGGRFARGIELEKLLADGLLVLAANGEPLPALHGGPLRLAVPGWYGINYVKWLDRLTLIDRQSASEMNRKSYVLYDKDGREYDRVRALQVKSMIVGFDARRVYPAGPLTAAGFAWADGTPISAVEVSLNNGPWQPAQLGNDMGRFAWRPFSFSWHAEAGRTTLRSRAWTVDGRVQPDQALPNLKGYQMHGAVPISVDVE